MNALFLVAATVVAFVFGYRFYAKLLALEIFRLDPNYSTYAQSRPDGEDYVPTHPHLLLGHHVAAITGITAFAAPILALTWGWIPVFLWITIGSTVAAGTYALGSFWLSSRHPEDIGPLARDLLGARARVALRLLTVTALLILVAASAGLAATLLAAYPEAVLPTAAMALIAWLFGSYLHGRAESRLLPASLVTLALALLSIWWLTDVPLVFAGQLTVSLGDSVHIVIDAVVVWVVLLLTYAFYSARAPVWKLMRPRGYLVALALAVMLSLFYAAIIVRHPILDAPEFHAPPSTVSALPWLFLVVGSGALAGWQLLIVRGVTGRELRRETDARYVGYGAALIQGLIALSALLLAAIAFADRGAWSHYDGRGVADFPSAATFYIDQYTRLVAALGLDPAFVRRFAATVLAGLSLAVLEAAVRALKNTFIEIAPLPATPSRRHGQRSRLWPVVLGGGILALHDGRGLGGLALWPLLALSSLWIAAAGFALIGLALRGARQPVQLALAAATVVAVVAAWTTLAQLWSWWQAQTWLGLGAGVVVCVLAGMLVGDAIAAARRPASVRPDAAP